MKLEYQTQSFPMDDDFKTKIDLLVAEGWGLVPGTVPVVVYHLQREIKVQSAYKVASAGALSIDDSKVEIIRANKAN
jgi:hypothetical protein